MAFRQEQVGKVSAFLTPQVAGDTADWFWMVLSTLVFMLLAAQLYKIYVFVAFPHLMHFHH
ncbi:hypothetical protein FOA52_009909 [Chlamydomonas sp. UWO 241]|nr:hypothetical protein FOA52_009909 [Chlamydomonas sp. UWO 241]